NVLMDCIQCENGYYVSDGNCLQCGEWCSLCNSLNQCLQCQLQYYLYNGSCLSKSDILNSHCTSVDPSGCTTCIPGYYISKGKCVSCEQITSNCILCSSEKNTCLKCAEDTILSDNTCVPYSTVAHCVSSIDNFCNKCSSWYKLTNDRMGCERRVLGWAVGVCIVCGVLFICIVLLILFVLYRYYEKRQIIIQYKRENGVFSLKHCDILLTPYPTLPTILSSTTLIEFPEGMELFKEYTKGFYIGNKGKELVELYFETEENDVRFQINFEPKNVVLEAGKCVFIKLNFQPKCSFSTQILFKTVVYENNVVNAKLDFKISTNTEETIFIDPKLIEIQSVMSGRYDVTSCKALYANTPVVVKDLGGFVLEGQDQKELDDPITVLDNFPNSPFLTKLIGKVLVGNRKWVVTEFAPLGTMQDFINKKSEMSQNLRLRVNLDIAKGLALLHSKGFLHLNIKPGNVMVMSTDLNEMVVAKLTDIGYHRNYKQFYNQKVVITKNPTYVAPEIICGQNYSTKSDVFAFGLTMFAISTLQNPYNSSEFEYPWKIAMFVCNGSRLNQPNEMPKQLFDTICNCWEHCAADRVCIDEVVLDLKKLQG
ncbi:serine-threonine protein kinase, partial [Entamoeba invadens IP1]